MFFRKLRVERRHRLGMLSLIEKELGSLIKQFPKVYMKVIHEKRESRFLIHQKRGEGKEDLHSFAWMKVIWGSKKKGRVEFSTREMHPEVCSLHPDCVYGAINEIKKFLEKHNAPRDFTLTIGE